MSKKGKKGAKLCWETWAEYEYAFRVMTELRRRAFGGGVVADKKRLQLKTRPCQETAGLEKSHEIIF